MKPRIKLAEAKILEEGTLTLYEHDGSYLIDIDRLELMNSRACASEELLGELGVATLKPGKPPRVLIGGLGLGFTLKAVLDAVGPNAVVEVAELIPEVIEWNKTHLQPLNGALLDDPRVQLHCADVTELIHSSEQCRYDVILLDIDNGPVALVANKNASLYGLKGLRLIKSRLKVGGRAVFWSGGPYPNFEGRLRQAEFEVQSVPAKVYAQAKKAVYRLYVADRVSSI